MNIEHHPDGSATIKFDGEDDMTRHSFCNGCMEQIGDEDYVWVKWPMARVAFHVRCAPPVGGQK